MESPKNAKIERAARKWRERKAEHETSSKAKKNADAKLRQLMHEGVQSGDVRRVVEGEKEWLVYQRANCNVRVEIRETVKVLLDEKAEEEFLPAEGGDGGDVEVNE